MSYKRNNQNPFPRVSSFMQSLQKKKQQQQTKQNKTRTYQRFTEYAPSLIIIESICVIWVSACFILQKNQVK